MPESSSSSVSSSRFLLLDNVDPVCAKTLAERGYEADQPSGWSEDDLKREISKYAGLVVRSGTQVDEALLEHATDLQVIGRAGVGVDNIDLAAATTRGVLVMNTPDGNTISTAEHTCGMILSLARNIPEAVARVKGGGWDRKAFMGSEVYGKTLGIIGLGKIGSEVARRMSAFGMTIVGFDPFATQEHADEFGIKLMSLEEVLGAADFLTVHTPLTDKTRGLISAKNKTLLKPGVRLVNCARGGIITEMDLPELLDEGIVSGVALDVYSGDFGGDELREVLAHPAVVCTPHLGASTEEAQEKVAEQIAHQLADAIENTSYKGSVNAKSVALLANPDVKPFLVMAERLGAMCGQLIKEHAGDLKVEYTGQCAKFADLLTDGILKGMLTPYISGSVNLINARTYANERGFSVSETTTTAKGQYNDLVRVTLEENDVYHTLTATLFGGEDPRVVGIDNFQIELRLEGELLVYQNQDIPGMLASVSGALASREINIGALSLGRSSKGERALTVLQVDRALDEDDLAAIQGIDGVENVHVCSLSRF
ncbi:MAG: phosphoglycerate dehydrogenase [Bacteroidetes bacterium]|nr:phosphoglycerate dehydrogenase [Bacteroidota bacterium]